MSLARSELVVESRRDDEPKKKTCFKRDLESPP